MQDSAKRKTKTKEQKAEKISTKDKIIKASWSLFHLKGFEDTTIEDIIDKAGISKGSFYYYFDRKDALLDTLSTILDVEYEKLEKEIDTSMNAFDKLLFLNNKIHGFIEENIERRIVASLYATQLYSKENSSLLDQNRIYYKFIADIVEEGQKKGEIITKKSVREITKYYSLCERALITDWCMEKGNYSLKEYSKEYLPIMMASFKNEIDK